MDAREGSVGLYRFLGIIARITWRGAIMATTTDLQYISDEAGNAVAVIVPIEIWNEIDSERETAHLSKSEAMKRRILEAKESKPEKIPQG
jgi:hypothetical protein